MSIEAFFQMIEALAVVAADGLSKQEVETRFGDDMALESVDAPVPAHIAHQDWVPA